VGVAAAAAVGLLLLLLVLPAPAGAELYRWMDADGIAHYTSDLAAVPADFRASARRLSSPRAPDGPARLAVEATVVTFTPGGPIIVSASLNGVPVRLLLDTGADRTLISPAAAARAGLGEPVGAPVQIVGVGGRVTAGEITVPMLDIGGTRFGNFVVIVHDTPLAHADGLLGRDILDSFTLTVDAAHGRVLIVPR
jgi:predicted aspartyl protease